MLMLACCRRVPAPGAGAGGRRVVHLRAGLPHGRVGRGRGADGVAEGAVDADGAGHRVRQPQGAGVQQDNVINRHNRLGTATRLAVEAWGLKNCTQKEEWFSNTVTAAVVPSYIDSGEIVKHAWKRYNLSLGLGLNKVAGKVFRIGHLGNLNEVSLLQPPDP